MTIVSESLERTSHRRALSHSKIGRGWGFGGSLYSPRRSAHYCTTPPSQVLKWCFVGVLLFVSLINYRHIMTRIEFSTHSSSPQTLSKYPMYKINPLESLYPSNNCSGDTWRTLSQCQTMCQSHSYTSILSHALTPDPSSLYSNNGSKVLRNIHWEAASCHRCRDWEGGDTVFQYIDGLNGPRAWGRILDAGVGKKSMKWLCDLPSEGVWGITSSQKLGNKSIEEIEPSLKKNVNITVGKWSNKSLLNGLQFDTILVDYLIGSLDGVEPYSQESIFARIRPHLRSGGRMYIIGNEPFPEHTNSHTGKLLHKTCKIRDACILSAGGRPSRELPLFWYINALQMAGFLISDIALFPTVYGRGWTQLQLLVAENSLLSVQQDSNEYIKGLLKELSHLSQTAKMNTDLEHGFCHGMDFAITAKME